MTILLSSDDVEELATEELVADAVRRAFRLEAEGRTRLPVRLDVPSGQGFFRVMPAVLDSVMGCKIMTLVRDKGTRYLVMLYDATTGGPVALVDADVLTKLRTAGVTALAAESMVDHDLVELSVLGTGFEARGHVECFARRFPTLSRVTAFSRSADNRADFERWCTSSLGLDVKLTESAEEAAAAASVSLLATKSPVAVVDGSAFPFGAVVLSIGSTRPDLRELDGTSFARARRLVMDSPDTVRAESGDVMAAIDDGFIDDGRLVSLATVIAGTSPDLPRDDVRDLDVFKSAGTALQDLALAVGLYERAKQLGRGRDIGEVSRMKPFLG